MTHYNVYTYESALREHVLAGGDFTFDQARYLVGQLVGGGVNPRNIYAAWCLPSIDGRSEDIPNTFFQAEKHLLLPTQ